MRAHQGIKNHPVVLVAFGAVAAVSLAATTWGQAGGEPKKKDEQVKVEAHLSVDRLPAGTECQILIRLTVEPGWHINAVPASPDTIETEVSFKGKLGTKLVRPKFPKGKKLKLMDQDEPVSVYDGKVDIRGVLQIPESAGGQTEEMEIAVKYQACNENICKPPTTVKLNGKLPVAKVGESVKKQNEKLFPPAAN